MMRKVFFLYSMNENPVFYKYSQFHFKSKVVQCFKLYLKSSSVFQIVFILRLSGRSYGPIQVILTQSSRSNHELFGMFHILLPLFSSFYAYDVPLTIIGTREAVHGF